MYDTLLDYGYLLTGADIGVLGPVLNGTECGGRTSPIALSVSSGVESDAL